MALWLYALWCLISFVWVALALAPIPPAAPAWLAATRAVCFGTLSNGLPDGYGWISLAAPLPMLGALLAIYGGELARPRARRWLVPLTLLPVAALSLIGQRLVEAPGPPPPPELSELPESYPRGSQPLPLFALVDQRGATITPLHFQGQVTFLTFAFSHCMAVCPTLVANLRAANKSCGVPIVVVTLDPWRDTPSSLPELFESWQLPAGSRVLSGPVEEVNRTLEAFQVTRDRNTQNGDIAHPALVYVVDPQGRIAYTMTNPTPVWLVEAARRARQ